MPEITICANCRYFLGKGSYLWYDNFCAAIENPKGIDPVTGQEKHYSQNDLGRTYFGANKHPYCRDINDGNCKHYEEK